jgi:hypothetical protein
VGGETMVNMIEISSHVTDGPRGALNGVGAASSQFERQSCSRKVEVCNGDPIIL